MRISGILMILLWELVSVCVANDSARQIPSSQSAVSSSSPDWLSPSSSRYADGVDRRYSRPDSKRDGDVTCFTMHTFLVKRESLRSEVTEPAGEATCLSGPRYSVRKVEELGKAPSR